MANISGPNGKSCAQLCWMQRLGGTLKARRDLATQGHLGEDSTDCFPASLATRCGHMTGISLTECE